MPGDDGRPWDWGDERRPLSYGRVPQEKGAPRKGRSQERIYYLAAYFCWKMYLPETIFMIAASLPSGLWVWGLILMVPVIPLMSTLSSALAMDSPSGLPARLSAERKSLKD